MRTPVAPSDRVKQGWVNRAREMLYALLTPLV